MTRDELIKKYEEKKAIAVLSRVSQSYKRELWFKLWVDSDIKLFGNILKDLKKLKATGAD